MARKLTQEEVIAKFKAVWKDRFDYSKVVYVNNKKKVTIICPVHGEFEQIPQDHWRGNCGCTKCSKTAKRTLEDFIKEAKNKYGDYYDYSKAEYKGFDKKVIIICPVHGEFEQTPHHHLRGGCNKCGREQAKVSISRSRLQGHEWWVAEVAKVNPNVEVLEKIVKGKTKVNWRCKICGHVWPVAPQTLVRKKGKGCPGCAKNGFLSHEHGRLYIMIDDLELPTMMKIGVSVRVEERRKDVLKSAKKIGAGIPNLYIIKTWEGPTEAMHALEQAMHKSLSQYKINFPVKFDGCQEFFYYRPEVFELIEEHLKKFSTEE